ncbi:MAG: hypothetical protein AB7E95_04265 [Kiritimatiellales bacterium]
MTVKTKRFVSMISLFLFFIINISFSEQLVGNPAAIENSDRSKVAVFQPGAKLFSNRNFTLKECPEFLRGRLFLQDSIDSSSFRVSKKGIITILTPESDKYQSSRCADLEKEGFIRVDDSLFQLFGDWPENNVRIYQKLVKSGEKYSFRKWVVVLGFSGSSDTELQSGAEVQVSENCQVDVFRPGAKLFTDRDFTVAECPEILADKQFLRRSINGGQFKVTKKGAFIVLTPESNQYQSSQSQALEKAGFQRVDKPALFQLFGDWPANRVRMYRKDVDAGEEYSFGKWTVILGIGSVKDRETQDWRKNSGAVLYNGIQLPETWPPEHMSPSSREPMPVPYLDCPPEEIPINIGRQLFVDDFLIETTDMIRRFHYPQKYAGNPVLKPETELEKDPQGGLAVACPKSGGVWWDPDEQIFKLWYEAGWCRTICYAVSSNGVNWIRPDLDAVSAGSNQVLPDGLRADSWTVVRDWWTDNPNAKYKIFVRGPGGNPEGAMCFESPEGIHFGDYAMSGVMGDRSTMFYNPFRRKWVFSLRSSFRGRSRHYWEADDFISGCKWPDFNLNGSAWEKGQPVIWTGVDELDRPDPYVRLTTQLYNLDAVAYESLMLGFYQIWRGPNNEDCNGAPKLTELNFAYSRDGFHWARPDRTTAIKAERTAGSWDRGYVQSLGNICVLRGNQIWFYYTGFAGDESNPEHGMYANGAMGIATLRRDGFASMDTQNKGSLTTRPVTFSGKYLFVNADVPEGSLRAEVLDKDGTVIKPFTLENSAAFTGDSTLQQLTWNGGSDLSALQEQPVRLRFELENGALYSFWVSRDETGRSDGYVAGGGPGYIGPTDTVGLKALKTESGMLQL